MSDEAKQLQIWVSECPKIGQRIVFSASNHKGDSQSAWQDGKVIEAGRVPNATTPWAVKVEYPTIKKKWGRRIMHCRWCAACEVIAVIDESTEVTDLERLYKL